MKIDMSGAYYLRRDCKIENGVVTAKPGAVPVTIRIIDAKGVYPVRWEHDSEESMCSCMEDGACGTYGNVEYDINLFELTPEAIPEPVPHGALFRFSGEREWSAPADLALRGTRLECLLHYGLILLDELEWSADGIEWKKFME